MGSQRVSVSQIGSQRPTLLHEPPDALDWTLSDIAVEWARDVAGYELYPWQEWLVRWTFVRRPDHLWAARDVGAEVPRQNGKNIWLEVVELVSLLEFGDRLIRHSAQLADTSHEHFVSMRERIEGNDELMRMMPTGRSNDGFVTANGKESIEFGNGARLQFRARAKSSGRGPRPQKVVLDEALVLDFGRLGSMAPGIVAQRNPQLIFASSAPKADSEVLHSMRSRALEPTPGDRLFYAAWNNDPDVDTDGLDAVYRANASLGLGRLTEESLLANKILLRDSPDEYRREHLGVPEMPAGQQTGPITAEAWAALTDADSRIVSHHCFAIDVSEDRKWASIGVAGRRSDGLLHVEVVDRRAGTYWLADVVADIWKTRRIPFRIERGSPAASFISILTELGVEVTDVSTAEHAQAVGMVIDAVNASTLRHLGGTYLSSAVAAADLRRSSDAAVWARRNARSDISPLVAVTLAAGGVPLPVAVDLTSQVW
jgi:hypothetical protein